MTASILANYLAARTKFAVEYSKKIVGEFSHPGVKGRLRELLVTELIEPLLPNGVSVTTGVLIDSKGTQSRQLDIIIYSSDALPPLVKSGEQSLIPVDAAIQVIEVKSRLDATEMTACIENADSVKSLFLLSPKLPPPFDQMIQTGLKLPARVETIFSVFAFDSDLKGKSEWERYLQLKAKANMQPEWRRIDNICVVGAGYWDPFGEKTAATDDYAEVLKMLALMANSTPIWKKIRDVSQLGPYFVENPE